MKWALCGLALDAAAVVALSFDAPLLFFLLHAGSVVCARGRPLLLASVAFLPLLGWVGAVFVVAPALRRSSRSAQPPWVEVPQLVLPFRPWNGAYLEATLARGTLADVLQYSADSGLRASAVTSLSALPDREAVPLLRLALRDPFDDVRLLAFAVLEQKRKRLERLLQDSADDRCIAEVSFELAYTGLAEGELAIAALARAEKHALLAVARGDASVELLLGRILLLRREPRRAEEAFSNAARVLPAEIVAPYLAEAAYLDGRFEDVRGRLAFLPAGLLRGVRRYWLEPQPLPRTPSKSPSAPTPRKKAA